MTDNATETALAKVVFTPSGKHGNFIVGTSLLDAARELGVDLDSVCGGRGLCGRCQVLTCLLYTSPSPRDRQKSRMPSSA